MAWPVFASLAWATALAMVVWPQHRRRALHATLFGKGPVSATQGVPVGPILGWPGLAAPWFRGAVTLSAWGAAVFGLAADLVYPVMVGNRLGLHTVPMLLSMIGVGPGFGLAGFFAEPVVVSATPGLLS